MMTRVRMSLLAVATVGLGAASAQAGFGFGFSYGGGYGGGYCEPSYGYGPIVAPCPPVYYSRPYCPPVYYGGPVYYSAPIVRTRYVQSYYAPQRVYRHGGHRRRY